MKHILGNLDDEKRLYMQIALFAMLLHIAYVIIFSFLSIDALMKYNIFSALFYIAIIFVVKKGLYKLSVIAVHTEVVLFVGISSLYGGMSMGMGMYLLSMASMVYFCPFEHKQIPYILAICHALMYVVLRIYTNFFTIYCVPDLSIEAKTFLHVFNACGSFMIILLSVLLMDLLALRKQNSLKKENLNLAAQANYDYLTGLQSRHFFTTRVEQLDPSVDISVAIGDIDDFKRINDTYGHTCGDYVLHSVADLMRKSINPEYAYICRWGGEEFTFLFHGISFDDACAELEKLRKRIENHHFKYNDERFNVTMTFGIVPSLGKPVTSKTIDSADKLLYKGKTQGKNQVVK